MTILENFLKSKKVKKTLATKPGEEGFSLVELVVVIAVLAILSAVAIPAFVGVQANARASAVKNGLANGVKECVVRDANQETDLSFAKAQAFNGNYSGYTVAKWDTGTFSHSDKCFAAQATTSKSGETWFRIEMSTVTGEVLKTCGDAAAPGCDTGKVW
tara:strand:- start:76 stop:552 length:477 start_codon:yes stop_codon:yes gene_type:complete